MSPLSLFNCFCDPHATYVAPYVELTDTCEELEEDSLKLQTDRHDNQDGEVIVFARDAWAFAWSAPRSSPVESRLDKGVKRAPKVFSASKILEN